MRNFVFYALLTIYIFTFENANAQWLYSVDLSAHNDRNYNPTGSPSLDGGYAVTGAVQGSAAVLKYVPAVNGFLGANLTGFFTRERYRRTNLPPMFRTREISTFLIGPEYAYFFGKKPEDARWMLGTRLLFQIDFDGKSWSGSTLPKRYWVGNELALDATYFVKVAKRGRIGLTGYVSASNENNYTSERFKNGTKVYNAGLRLKFFVLQ
jgi:hypothetical protein